MKTLKKYISYQILSINCTFVNEFLMENKKVCVVTIHIQVNNITHPEREYIV